MKAYAIRRDGTALRYDPLFSEGDGETRLFASNGKATLKRNGVTIAISDDVDRVALNEAIRILTECRASV